MNSSLLSLGDQEPGLFDEFTLEFTTDHAAVSHSTQLVHATLDTDTGCLSTTPMNINMNINYNNNMNMNINTAQEEEDTIHPFLIDHPDELVSRNGAAKKSKSLDEASSLISVADANELLGVNMQLNMNVRNTQNLVPSESSERDYVQYSRYYNNNNGNNIHNINNVHQDAMNLLPPGAMPMSIGMPMSDGQVALHATADAYGEPPGSFFVQASPIHVPVCVSSSEPMAVNPLPPASAPMKRKFECMPVWQTMPYSGGSPPPHLTDLSMSIFGGISSGPTMFHPTATTPPAIPSTTISHSGVASLSDGVLGNNNNNNNSNNSVGNVGSLPYPEEVVYPTGLETPECLICRKLFPDQSALKSHRRKSHPKPKKYPCNISGCTVRFSAKCNLSKHVKSVHQKQRPHVCGISGCKRAFSERNKLLKHEETVHNGLRPYRCAWEGCHAEFGQKSDRTRHINVVHKGERRYQCNNCKAFGRKSSLAQHLLRVHGIRQNAVNAIIGKAQEKLEAGEDRLVVFPPPRPNGAAA